MLLFQQTIPSKTCVRMIEVAWKAIFPLSEVHKYISTGLPLAVMPGLDGYKHRHRNSNTSRHQVGGRRYLQDDVRPLMRCGIHSRSHQKPIPNPGAAKLLKYDGTRTKF
jgi:hypothetical protein